MELAHRRVVSITQARTARQQPLAEGLTDGSGKVLRFSNRTQWWILSDDRLRQQGQDLVDSKHLKNQQALKHEHYGLYDALKRRGLLKKLAFEMPLRRWRSNDELVMFAQRLIEKNGLRCRSQLKRLDAGVHEILRRRRLMDALVFERKVRHWNTSDAELRALAEKFMKKRRIRSPMRLYEKDPGLYGALSKRRLLPHVHFAERRVKRDWSRMDDAQVVAYAHYVIGASGAKNARDLLNADGGVYHQACKRGLAGRLIYDESERKRALACRKPPVEKPLPFTVEARETLDDVFPAAYSYREKAAMLSASLEFAARMRKKHGTPAD